MQTERQLQLAVDDVFEQLRQDNIVYVELRLSPFLHTEQGLAVEGVVEIVADAMMQASQRTGIEARLILVALRHFSVEQSMQTARLVEQFMAHGVAGLDLGAYEAAYPLYAHVSAFQYAMQHHIPRTVHAGENLGAESVWDTLNYLHPSRIGHGVRSVEDPSLIAHLRQEHIHLEVCPTSNLCINLYERAEEHPINFLYESGLSVSVNSDTRTLTETTLTREYELLSHVFGWDEQHFLTCNLQALQAAFLPQSVKRRIEEQLRVGYR